MTPYYEDDCCTIYHGACEDVLPTISGVDLVVTSPPYNQLGARVGGRQGTNLGMHRGNRWVAEVAENGYEDDRSEVEYVEWQSGVARMLAEVVRPGGSFFYNHKIRYRESRPIHPIDLVRSWDGWWLRQEIVWDRSGSMVLNARMFPPSDERVYWLVRDGGTHAWNQEAVAWMSVWRMAPPSDVAGHPCPFPIALVDRCVLASSAPGDTVLDPFMGSGTTLRSAKNAGRKAVGIEPIEAYCEIAAKRLAQGVLDFGASA